MARIVRKICSAGGQFQEDNARFVPVAYGDDVGSLADVFSAKFPQKNINVIYEENTCSIPNINKLYIFICSDTEHQ